MLATVRNTMATRLPPLRGQRVLVAISGGADSVALTLALHHLGVKLVLAHVNHGIRGRAAAADARFVAALARRLALPLVTGKFSVPQERHPGESLEMAARRNEGRQITITANPAVASVLIGTSGKNQQALESKTNKKISIRSNPLLPLEQYEITTDDHRESSTSLLPVEEHQILKVKIESVHNQKPDDGVARVSGFVLNIKDGGKYVGQELWVEITRIFRTYAWAEILNRSE